MFSFNFQIAEEHAFEDPPTSTSNSTSVMTPADASPLTVAPPASDLPPPLAVPTNLSPAHVHRLVLLFLSADLKSEGALTGEELDEIAIMPNLGELARICRDLLQNALPGAEVSVSPLQWLTLFGAMTAAQIDEILYEAGSMRDTFPPLSFPSFVTAKQQKQWLTTPGPNHSHTLSLALAHANVGVSRFVFSTFSPAVPPLDFLQNVDEGREKLVRPAWLSAPPDSKQGEEDDEEEEEETDPNKLLEQQEEEHTALGKRLQSLGDLQAFLVQCGATFTNPPTPFKPPHFASIKTPEGNISRDVVVSWLKRLKSPTSQSVQAKKGGILNLYREVLRGGATIESFVEKLRSLSTAEERSLVLDTLVRCANRSLSPEGGEATQRPYCQICHRVVGVATCQGCGVVAYCSEGHCELDCALGTHSAVRCKELLLSRMIANLPAADVTNPTPLSNLAAPSPASVASSSATSAESKAFSMRPFPESWDDLPRPGDVLDQLLSTDNLSFVMTVAWSLHHLGLLSASSAVVASPAAATASATSSAVATAETTADATTPAPAIALKSKSKLSQSKKDKQRVRVHVAAEAPQTDNGKETQHTSTEDNNDSTRCESTTANEDSKEKPAKRSIVVYVLGAAEQESRADWEYLLQWCGEDVTRVTVVLIGPQVVPISSLKADGRLRVVSVVGLLHHCLDQLTQGKPDLIFALNSGIHWYESWVPTLRLLVGFGCPFIVTAWQVIEALSVREVLLEKHFQEIISLRCNKFASLLPQPVRDQHAFNNRNNWFIMGFLANPTDNAATQTKKSKPKQKNKQT